MDVLQRRSGQEDQGHFPERADDTPAQGQALRGAEHGETARPKKSDEERMSIFWRVFGGAILSIIALAGMTLFNNLMNHLAEIRSDLNRSIEARSTSVAELRADIARSNEARADMVRKDEFNARMTSNWDRIQALQQQNNTQASTLVSMKAEIDGLKERLAKQATDLESMRKDSATAIEAVKKDLTATAESIRKEIAALELLKERISLLASEQKASRDEYLKLRQDVDRNQSNDMERKDLRDTQYRQIDEALKEVQKGLQDCREKLARLEGQNGTPPVTPKKTDPAGPSRTDPNRPTGTGGR